MLVLACIVGMAFDGDMLDSRVCEYGLSDLVEEGVGFLLDGRLIVVEVDFVFDFDFVFEDEDDLLALVGASVVIFDAVDDFGFVGALVGASADVCIFVE